MIGRTTLAFALMLFASGCATQTPKLGAASDSNSVNAKSDVGFCLDVSDMAKNSMVIRQEGAAMDQVFREYIELGMDFNSDSGKILKQTLEDAYEEPVYSSEKKKEHAINLFAHNYMKYCIARLRK